MENCVFCRIVSGIAPASIVYSDDKTMAFMDSHPINPGHVLVIPKTHSSGLAELNEEVGAHMFRVAMRVAGALKCSGIRCEGTTLFLADGKAAHQEIFHVHFHVIPRFGNDGFGIRVPPSYASRPEPKELDVAAEKIRRVMP
jgi:histidine triad (HIT) family protein